MGLVRFMNKKCECINYPGQYGRCPIKEHLKLFKQYVLESRSLQINKKNMNKEQRKMKKVIKRRVKRVGKLKFFKDEIKFKRRKK